MQIQGRVSQHDKYQIEMKFTCPVDPERNINDYHIDVFFFLPRNLSVNQHTYGRDLFYNDLSEYIRLSIPHVGIAALAVPGNIHWQRLADAVGTEQFTEQLKMYCSILKTAFRDSASLILESSSRETVPEKARLYAEQTEQALSSFRALRSRLPEDPETLELFDLVDEFLSITVNRHKYRLWIKLAESGFPPESDIIRQFRKSAEKEIRHRQKAGCPSVPLPGAENSELLYRESTLKKAMASILFLKTDMRKDGVLLENILLSISAALAMIFVTGISFLWKGLFLEEFSLSFFVVWVVAYMFKDRIKALLQAWFSSHKEWYSFDYKQKISDAMGRTVGICREGVCYRKEHTIDPELMKLRNRTSLSRLENGSLSEEILVFRKRIELYSKACQPLYKTLHVTGVTDIVRFNVRSWLKKMDNPVKPVYYPEEDGTLGLIRAKRIYHVNMLIRYREKDGPAQYMKYRLILSRNGIRKVEMQK